MERLPYVITVRLGRSRVRVSPLFRSFCSPSSRRDTARLSLCTCSYTYTRVRIAGWPVFCGFRRARVRHVAIQPSTVITGRQQMRVLSFLLHASNSAKAFYERSRTCHRYSPVCPAFFSTLFPFFSSAPDEQSHAILSRTVFFPLFFVHFLVRTRDCGQTVQ